MDHGAIVVGGGHNGLVCAAYLARAGIDTLLVEARASVGGCASTVDALGARVNICNCDHTLFRATPVMDELRLAEHGLRYLDVDPAQLHLPWDAGPAWPIFHSAERTAAGLAALYPDEADNYRRYVKAARPVAELVTEVATAPPTPARVLGTLLERRFRGLATLLRWSRMTTPQVLRHFFHTEALFGPAIATGPGVWGLSPHTPRTGLGALGYAMKHVAQVGRPVGGSGAVPDALLGAFESFGGKTRCASRVSAILCEGDAVRGIQLDTGEVVEAPLVVAACDPHAAIVGWLRNPPAAAHAMVERWRTGPTHEGYESKLDAVVTSLPRYRQVDAAVLAELGVDDPLLATTIVSPPLADIARAHSDQQRGHIAERPMFYVNVPSVLDPTMQVQPDKSHVFSLEVLFTPYRLDGGWTGSTEPRRWLKAFATLVEPGFDEGVQRWRAVTPPDYERDFNMPKGYATSFAGGPLAALLGRRPELTRYQTPVRGLYLTGAATFPGAGVWGASGRNTATVILAS